MSKDAYERPVAAAGGLRLHLNENTAGCSPKVLEALRRLGRGDVASYPDYAGVTAACAARLDVPADRVLLTNGLDEGILVTSLGALRGRPDADALIIEPAFDMYAACVSAAGARPVRVLPEADLRFPLARVLDAMTPATRLIFLTNPNNPTGELIARDAIEAIAARAPRAFLLLDEAYADFADETFLRGDGLDRFPNVIVGRTFAKAYGLAGLRAGALVAAPQTLGPLRAIVPPYSLNAAAVAALAAAFEDDEYVRWYVEQVAESRELIYAAAERLQLRYWPSAANFVLVHAGERAGGLLEGLAHRGIFVRDRSADPGCQNCLRITAGVVEHTRRCLVAIEELLCAAG
jgi:histidinol-phosphate aminotransferase